MAALNALSRIGTKRSAEEAMQALRGVSMSRRQMDAWMNRFEKIQRQK
jgi:hypothetical protein